MNCEQADAVIQESLDRSLTAAERAELDTHLAVCPACRIVWDEYWALSGLTNGWARQSTPPVTSDIEFAAQVLTRIQQQASRRSFVSRPRWGLAVVSAVLLAGLTVMAGLTVDFHTLWQAVLPGCPHPTGWLPEPRTATPALAWIAAALRDMPHSAAQLWSGLVSGRVQTLAPTWSVGVLAAAFAANAALYLRATMSRGRSAAS